MLGSSFVDHIKERMDAQRGVDALVGEAADEVRRLGREGAVSPSE